MILTKGSELFDKSVEDKEEDKEIACLAIINPRSIAGIR
jgi:hypothetical protein